MRTFLGVCVGLFLCGTTVLAAEPAENSSPGDKARIQGTWSIDAMRESRNDVPQEQFAKVRVVIDAKTIVFQNGDQDAIRIEYALDPKHDPKTLDTTHEIDPGKPIVQLGIYELEGDTLKLGFAAAGQPRPKDFASKSATVFVLKRKFADSSSPD